MNIQTAQGLMRSIIKEAKIPQYKQKQFYAALEVLTVKEPAPAPMPGGISWELRELAAYAGKNPGTPLSFIYDRIVLTITAQARRLAEVEANNAVKNERIIEFDLEASAQARRLAEVEAELVAIDSEAGRRPVEKSTLGAVKYALRVAWAQSDANGESWRRNVSRAKAAEARVVELEACLGLCRQCQYPGVCCKDCPHDIALAGCEEVGRG